MYTLNEMDMERELKFVRDMEGQSWHIWEETYFSNWQRNLMEFIELEKFKVGLKAYQG